MKALSLWQPWASLIVAGVKTIETRTWRTSYTGPLAIHAAKLSGVELWRRIGTEAMRELDATVEDCWSILHRQCAGWLRGVDDLPRGRIVGTVDLLACVQIPAPPPDGWNGCGIFGRPLTEIELRLGDYTPGRWAWVMTDPYVFEKPVPCRGHQALWNVPEELVEVMCFAGYLEDR